MKTFYAKTMALALREIKDALGPDALLLSAKEIPQRSGMWGRSSGYEVVAAVDRSEDIDIFSPSGMYKAGKESEIDRAQELTGEQFRGTVPGIYSPAATMNHRSGAVSAKSARTKRADAAASADGAPSADLQLEKEFSIPEGAPLALYQELISCGVEMPLVRELMQTAWDSLANEQRNSRPALLRSVARAARARIAPPSTRDGMPDKKVVAFVGPAGSGKTTSIAKLAAHLALQRKKKVLLATLDSRRIGAIEQLKSYAGLMGIPFRFIGQAPDVSRVIEENRQRDYILIDTAGHGPRDMDAINSLAAFLKASETVERHLVLSAATKPSDMRKIMDRFEICSPDHLLFTRLDETATPGPIFNELVRTQKGFSYYADGQKVPDDLHTVAAEGIIDIVLHRNENTLKE